MTHRHTPPSLAAVLAAAITACGPLAPPPAPPPPPDLGHRVAAVVDSILGTPPHHRAQWGILVRDAATGQHVYALNAERNFVPASNMKLVTGAVALAELGEEYRYATEVAAAGMEPGDTVGSTLLVRGRGDPTLSARFHDAPFAALDSLADSVALRGIRRFRDGLVVDASWQADGPLHFAWFLGNLPSRFAAGTAAFGIEEGTLLLVVGPGDAMGAPARVQVLPRPGVADLTARLVTGAPDASRQIASERKIPGDTLVLTGTIPLGSPPDTLVLAAPEPAVLAARALAGALEGRGVRVDGPVRVVRDTAELEVILATASARPFTDSEDVGPLPGVGTVVPLLTWTSPPMTEIVPAFMLPSQNWIAELVMKTVGAEREGEGSWAAGLDVFTRFLEESVGLDPAGFFLRDASGLSNQNLLTPAGIVALLDHARAQPWFGTFHASLPRPGQEGGTLSGRLAGLEDQVAAKTGTVTHVNGLSGYLVTATGRELTFSILTNVTGAPAPGVRAAMDRVVRELAGPGGH